MTDGGRLKVATGLVRYLLRGKFAQSSQRIGEQLINMRPARRSGLALQLPQQCSVETPRMVCRAGVRELQRASEIGHGGQGRPLLQIGGRLHVESHPLPRPDAKDTCSRRLEPCGLRNGQELFRRHVAQLLDDARGPFDAHDINVCGIAQGPKCARKSFCDVSLKCHW